jgi:hypothetical protein
MSCEKKKSPRPLCDDLALCPSCGECLDLIDKTLIDKLQAIMKALK